MADDVISYLAGEPADPCSAIELADAVKRLVAHVNALAEEQGEKEASDGECGCEVG